MGMVWLAYQPTYDEEAEYNLTNSVRQELTGIQLDLGAGSYQVQNIHLSNFLSFNCLEQ